jgi:hypothetical protein
MKLMKLAILTLLCANFYTFSLERLARTVRLSLTQLMQRQRLQSLNKHPKGLVNLNKHGYHRNNYDQYSHKHPNFKPLLALGAYLVGTTEHDEEARKEMARIEKLKLEQKELEQQYINYLKKLLEVKLGLSRFESVNKIIIAQAFVTDWHWENGLGALYLQCEINANKSSFHPLDYYPEGYFKKKYYFEEDHKKDGCWVKYSEVHDTETVYLLTGHDVYLFVDKEISNQEEKDLEEILKENIEKFKTIAIRNKDHFGWNSFHTLQQLPLQKIINSGTSNKFGMNVTLHRAAPRGE